MKAARIEAIGDAPRVGTIEDPSRTTDSQVVIKVETAALNAIDLHIAAGRHRAGAPRLPYAPGVESVGSCCLGNSPAPDGLLSARPSSRGLAGTRLLTGHEDRPPSHDRSKHDHSHDHTPITLWVPRTHSTSSDARRMAVQRQSPGRSPWMVLSAPTSTASR